MPVMTRLESNSAQVDTVIEEVKKSGGFCILQSSALEMILSDSKALRTETHELNIKVATSIERVTEAIEKLTQCFEASNTQTTNNNNELIQRLGLLIDKVSMNNSLSSSQEETDIEAELKKRKETLEKIIRNEETSEYYAKLIGEESPFARREFRTHVNQNTSERELTHRKQQTIDKVNTEILIMKDRVAEYEQRKAKINEKIEEYLTTHEDVRTTITDRMQSQERTLRDTFHRNTLNLMKESDNKEKMNSFEYLLKFSDSLNYRGSSSRTRNRRAPRRQGRGNQRGY